MKISFYFIFAFFLFYSCNSSNSNDGELEKEENNPPNILWIVSEDNSPFLGCYGDVIAKTPHLDLLAKNGLIYDNAFVNAPVCSPSRSTLITGMYPTSLGTEPMRCLVTVPDYVKFFPKYLKDNGYYTTLRLKRDYNIEKQKGTWDKDDFWNLEDALTTKKEGQPFFMFYNTWMSHESKMQDRASLPEYYKNTFKNDPSIDSTITAFHDFDPAKITLPKYLPDNTEMREDWAWYYKAMQIMDFEVGKVLSFLKKEKLLENTIVIYTSDHGGVLGRSKRFCYESGLKIPMIVYFPEKYRNLMPTNTDGRTDRIVSFVDMAPSILSLAGVKMPKHMQGSAFIGKYNQEESPVAFGFRGRMDEAYDLVRTVRDKKFRYIRNYMPYRPNGQHLFFLWKAKSMIAWERDYKDGKCNDLQSAFFEPRDSEELFDTENDPDNIYNLAQNHQYAEILEQLRKINNNSLLENLDTGFFPEGELWDRSNKGKIPYKQIMEDNKKECIAAINAAEKATRNPDIKELLSMVHSSYASVRFWGATGCIVLGKDAAPLKQNLIKLLNDSSVDVSVTAAESLFLLGEEKLAGKTLIDALSNENIYVRLRALNVIANRKITSKKLINTIKNLDQSNEYIKNICGYILVNK